jgi:hypothetical protein
MLHDAHALADLANEIETALRQLATPPVLTFPSGDDVVLADLPERTADEDRQAQRAMAEQWAHDNERLEKARSEAGVTALLDDTAPAHSHDRDHRPAAAE